MTYTTTLPLGRFKRWIGNRGAAMTLHRLDDHLLKDMGLSRSEIERAVKIGRIGN
jgi:uncharacterized protein YjiS (DUF1127 family)